MSAPPGVCTVRVDPQERYLLIRVSVTYFERQLRPATVTTTHIDPDDALAAVAKFLRGYTIPAAQRELR